MRHRFVFALSFGLGLLAAGAGIAAAKSVRQSGFACFSSLNYGGAYFLHNRSTTASNEIFCPAVDTDYMRKQDYAHVRIHGYTSRPTSSPGVNAKICMSYWDDDDGGCSTYKETDKVGDYALEPSLQYWGSSYSSDFGYIFIQLPPSVGTDESSMRGWYGTDQP